jgi:hypothetical protein
MYSKQKISLFQVQQLVVQVGILADGQATAKDSFTQFKQDSGTLAARIIRLEEHIKEIETGGEENLLKEQKKSQVLLENKENEKRIAKENYDARCCMLHDYCHMLYASCRNQWQICLLFVTLDYHLVWWLGYVSSN